MTSSTPPRPRAWPRSSRIDQKKRRHRDARRLSPYIVEEIQSQRRFCWPPRESDFAVRVLDVHVPELLDRICTTHRRYPAGSGKSIELARFHEQPVIWTDEVLLGRVLGNLLKNALEASDRGQQVTVSFENKKEPIFSIHNPAVMPEAVRLQMFQRSFTTRAGRGRGIGTYSVKLLTEKYLHGRVWFVSSEQDGTTFFVGSLGRPGTFFPMPSSISPRSLSEYCLLPMSFE